MTGMSDLQLNRLRFTDLARQALDVARQEARRLNLDYVGTEHILLGLLKVRVGVAVSALKELGVDRERVILRVESLERPGANIVSQRRVEETARAKKTIEFAATEAEELGHDYVGTEHLMLGLFREGEGVAGQILMGFDVRLDTFRTETLRLLNHGL
jgi:ATP-dependent Clp protease ATP-binding subunit ClpC